MSFMSIVKIVTFIILVILELILGISFGVFIYQWSKIIGIIYWLLIAISFIYTILILRKL